jgi:lysophospholipid acyltransferase (LPLAT)-like uncharacterized protein
MRISPSIKRFADASEPFLVGLWHRDIFSIGEVNRRIKSKRQMVAMVSPSGDGEWLAALFRKVGINSIRGSSGRGAIRVYVEALRSLKSGCDVAITPDGPRGPGCRCKRGIGQLSLKTSTPILIISISYGAAVRLSTWDRMYLPLPFSKLSVHASYIEPGELALLPTHEDQNILLERALSATGQGAQ